MGNSHKTAAKAKPRASTSSTASSIEACIRYNRCDGTKSTIPNLEEERKQQQDEAMAKLYEKGPPSEEDLVSDYIETCTGSSQAVSGCREKLSVIQNAERQKNPDVAKPGVGNYKDPPARAKQPKPK